MIIKDYTGQKQEHGLLTAIERIPNYKNKRTYYKCLCDCGNITFVEGANFSTEHTISCGCRSSRNGTKHYDFLHQYRIDSDKEIYCVYRHISPNGKSYIGMTKQTVERRSQSGKGYKTQRVFYRAIQKYGWDNFQHNILEENLTHNEACEKEQYYIKKYKTNQSKYGYNVTFGGDGCRGRGNPVAQIHDGIIVNTFVSIKEASEELSIGETAISNYVKDSKIHGGYIFKNISLNEYFNLDPIINKNHLKLFKKNIKRENSIKSRNTGKKRRLSICQYSLEGKFIKIFDGINEARFETGINNISHVLKNEYGQAGGYMWKYYLGSFEDIKPYNTYQHGAKSVIQINQDTNQILSIYVSMKDAELKTGIDSKQISAVCTGKRKNAGGYFWKYKD